MKPSITLLTTLLPVPLAACRSAAEEKAIPDVPAAAAAGEKWERQARPLLENFNNMYQPCVAEVSGEWRSRMWFFGSATATGNPGVPSFDAIFHARSKDILNWEVYSQGETWDRNMNPAKWAPVLHASERWFEEWHIVDPSIVRKDGKFHMAYSTRRSTSLKNETEPNPTQSVYPIVHRAHGAGPVYCCHRLGGGNANPEAGQ